MKHLNQIVHNAQQGAGPCNGCPAQSDTAGRFVNPGLINPDAELMFLTMDPSHFIDWGHYTDWSEYNADIAPLFKEKWPGGRSIAKILSGIPGVTLSDIWLADAVKCPVNNDKAGEVDTEATFHHCSTYLRREIEEVKPSVIITMGNDPAEQLLNGVFDRDIGSIRAGSEHCGQTYNTNPPVVISPHWAHGWLDRNGNREKVVHSLRKVLENGDSNGNEKFTTDFSKNDSGPVTTSNYRSMAGEFPQSSFTAAYKAARNYPAQGKRSKYDGVPSRPTLTRYSAAEALGFDPFGKPIRGTDPTKRMLATILKLAAGIDRSLDEIESFTPNKSTLKKLTEGYVYVEYPGSGSLIDHFDHVDYVGPVLVAICAYEYDIDPVNAVRNHLSGETKYLDAVD